VCGVIRARDIIHRIVLFESARVTWRALNSPLFDTSRQGGDAKYKKKRKRERRGRFEWNNIIDNKNSSMRAHGRKKRERRSAPSRENVSARAYLEENPGKKANAYLFLEHSLPNV
jgi:hypothetical protein